MTQIMNSNAHTSIILLFANPPQCLLIVVSSLYLYPVFVLGHCVFCVHTHIHTNIYAHNVVVFTLYLCTQFLDFQSPVSESPVSVSVFHSCIITSLWDWIHNSHGNILFHGVTILRYKLNVGSHVIFLVDGTEYFVWKRE